MVTTLDTTLDEHHDTGDDPMREPRAVTWEDLERLALEKRERAARVVVSAEERAQQLPPTGCDRCDTTNRLGWSGHGADPAFHCRGCHRGFNSRREMHCVSCHRHFATAKACDAHQRNGGCQDPAEVTRRDGSPKFRVTEGEHGPTWRLTLTDAQQARLAEIKALHA